MAFGSGEIEAEVASDTVEVGSLQADLKDQLLLMVDRALDLKGTFEGILGLGIPESAGLLAGNHSSNDSWTGKHGVHHKANGTQFVTKSFLELAGITRFSMCFQDSGNGTLRLNTPALTNPLGSVGQAHWGLDFRGISVGSASTATKICKSDNLPAGQETPCGAIPDSGTTLIMGPKDQLVTLYEDICESWPRCKTANDAGVATAAGIDKANLLELMLANCSNWINETDQGLNELPELHFHLRGKADGSADGPSTTLAFKGSDYVEMGMLDAGDSATSFESRTTLSEEPLNDFVHRLRSIHGIGIGSGPAGAPAAAPAAGGPATVPVAAPGDTATGNAVVGVTPGTLVCLAAMGSMQYKTELNGPVWILGTPLFYAFQVSYDLDASPPAIQLAEGTCSTCGSTLLAEEQSSPVAPQLGLLKDQVHQGTSGARKNRRDHAVRVAAQSQVRSSTVTPRRIQGKARRPTQVLDGPL